jgi:hypothetical protein
MCDKASIEMKGLPNAEIPEKLPQLSRLILVEILGDAMSECAVRSIKC